MGIESSHKTGLSLGLFLSLGAYYGPALGFSFGTLLALCVGGSVIAHLFEPLDKRSFQRIGATIFGITNGTFSPRVFH